MASNSGKSDTNLSPRRGGRTAKTKPLAGKAKQPDVAGDKPEAPAKASAKSASSRRAAAKPAAKGKSTSKAATAGAKASRGSASSAATRKPAAKAGTKTAAKAAAKPAATRAAPKAKAKSATKPAGGSAKPAETPAAAAEIKTKDVNLEDVASTRASDAEAGAVADGGLAAAVDPIATAFETAFTRMMPIESGVATAQVLTENLERIDMLNQRLIKALSSRTPPNPAVEMPGPDLYMAAASGWLKTLTEQPARIIENQVNYWGETLKLYAQTQTALTGMGTAEQEEEKTDKRFSNPLWRNHPFFSYVRRQYEINANAMSATASELDLPDETARRRVNWLTSQIIDMMAPTNFLATNPDALEKAIETEGESLVKGLENLVRDVELNGGEMLVSLADRDAFTVGENIGTAEGTVVHRTALYEMIQYKPTTEEVHEFPLVIFPPWINKFYILDLKPQNSMIRWLVDQGFTLFVISWKNPDPSYAEVGIEHYVAAYLDAMEKVLTLTDAPKLNAVGYCIAGTTLSLTLALMAKKGDDRVNSATLFTALTDFSDQGEFTTFLQDDFVDGIEAEVRRDGILKSQIMSRTMSFLRANDLVWGPAIRSYMMGETPPAFDLLYWNGDSTNLPAKMTIEYLRELCQKNAFATDGFSLMGETVRLSDVTLPLCAVACETDHIAPWKDCWRGVSQMGSKDKRFILSESGHIAGIVNPPSKKKYGNYTGSDDFSHGHEAWKEDARFSEGSWWPIWGEWLTPRSGSKVPARDPGQGYGPAPGLYVHERGGLKKEG